MKITKEQYYALRGIHSKTEELGKQIEELRNLACAIVGLNPDNSDFEFDEVFSAVLIGDFDSQLARANIEVVE